jgi:16S rRNA (uracil1498-N3)-methyltransferase
MVLAQAVPKGSAMDSIIRRATELGAGAVVPIQAERSVSLLKGNRGLQKLERWRRTARQAAQQSSRLTVPRIEPVQSLSRFLQGSAQADVKIMLHQEEKAMGLSRVLSGIKGAEKANLLVGPEGGFTPREVEEAREDGYSVVSLGARILRTETASLALLSILMYEMGEMEP